jgi:hypothetical protein
VEQAMQIQDGIQGEAMAARLPALRAASAACGEDVETAQPARRRALGDLGHRLGLDFSDVASALRALLARSAEQGKDGVPDVLATLERALEQTGRALRKAGYSEEQIGRALDGVREQLGAAAAASAEVASTQSTSYLRKDKASLAITTQEGDRVQIRFRSREGFVSQTATTTAGAEERRVYAFASGRVEIAVQGELDDEELAAISELVGKVEALATNFFAGDAQKAFAAAASLGFDAEQIAGFALRLSTRESLSRRSIGGPARPAADKPAIAAPAKTAAAAPSSPAVPAADAAAPAVAPPADAAEAAKATAVQGSLADYLRGLLDTLATPSGAGRYTFSMQWKLEVVVAAVRAQEPAAQPGAASGLLAGSLAALGQKVSEESPAPAAA